MSVRSSPSINEVSGTRGLSCHVSHEEGEVYSDSRF